MMNSVRVGVCGLGNMGLEIATRMAPSHPSTCFDIDEAARANARQRGLEVVDELTGLDDCDIVLLSLPHSKASRQTAAGLARVLRPEAIVLESSTVAPADIDVMASDLETQGVRLIDAAIISGVPAMSAGTSTMLIGALEDTVDEAVAGVLDRLSAKLTWTGALGSAMAMKVIHNAVAHATMVTLAEARAMGQAYGITESALVDILRGEEAGLLRPLLHRLGERVPRRDYEGGMSLAAARKDSVLAQGMAAERGIPLYSIASSHTAYENAMRSFDGRVDYAVIAELWRTD